MKIYIILDHIPDGTGDPRLTITEDEQEMIRALTNDSVIREVHIIEIHNVSPDYDLSRIYPEVELG